MIVAAPASNASEGTYLESILDALKFLPIDLQRNMQLIYQLDAHAEQLREEIQQQRDFVLIKSDSDSKRSKPFDLAALRKLRRLERKCIKLLDEKLIIAKECYKIANSHLTRVDMDLQRFERELGPYTRDEDFEDYMSQNIGIPLRSRRLSIDRSSPMIASPLPLSSVPPSPRQQIVIDEPRTRADGPILSEQTYCYCKQASYGQMVACDDEKCPIQWWHFKCAGITETPTGVWYCRICSERRNK